MTDLVLHLGSSQSSLVAPAVTTQSTNKINTSEYNNLTNSIDV